MNDPSTRPSQLPHLLDGPAQYERGVDLLLGRADAQPDLGLAVICFLNAAACDDARGLYAAGMMYLRGIGVMGNRQLAENLLQAAASQQHPTAKRALQALRQDSDVSVFPIVPLEVAERPTAWGAGSNLLGRAWSLLRPSRRTRAPKALPSSGTAPAARR